MHASTTVAGGQRRSCISERSPGCRRRLGALVVVAVAALSLSAPGRSSAAAVGLGVDACTIASTERRATIEVRVVHAADLCELLSQALAGAVFRSSLLVTPGHLWHYPDTVATCRLRYRHTEYRLAVFNAADACRWLVRHATGWNVEAVAGNPAIADGRARLRALPRSYGSTTKGES
jgi:hypothetical protein